MMMKSGFRRKKREKTKGNPKEEREIRKRT